MKLMTRAAATLAVLTAAAIPVAALTIKNTSTKDVTAAVDTGTEEAVYTVPAGGSVDVTQDCSSGCAVTGPWGYSRMVSQNDAIETDGAPLVTVRMCEDKAYTAASVEEPTADLLPDVQPGRDLFGLFAAEAGRMIVFGGGVPLFQDGTLAGGLGVAGGTVEQDLEIARAAAEAWPGS